MTVPQIKLNNGVQIPQLGMGVFKMQNEAEFYQAFQWALEIGYRHFDTAAFYGNEQWLGAAIKKAGIDRKELFITSKLWPTQFQEPEKAYQQSLDRLGMDYLDLYLIHWPAPGFESAWSGMEKLYHDHQVRAIGVSNFLEKHLSAIAGPDKVTPAVDQLEIHPYFQRSDLVQHLQQQGIAVEAWGPLGQARNGVFDEPVLKTIAQAHHKTVQQVILRWHLQRQTIIFPKSIHQERLQQNFEVFDFELTASEMQQISQLDKQQPNGSNPADQDFLDHVGDRPLPY